MIIGGLEKLTLLDFPGKIATIVFTQGCNFRCHYCYNPMLVWPNTESLEPDGNRDKGYPLIKEDDLFLFLESRRGKLEGVVISGGEPTLHADLPEFISRVRSLGYDIKLDTNGTNPSMLERLITEKLIDYVAMDIKASPDTYEMVAGASVNLDNLLKSVKMIKESGIPYEFRSTILPVFHNEAEIRGMGKMIQGAEIWYLQKFKPDTELVDKFFEKQKSFTDKEIKRLAEIGAEFVKECRARI